MMSLQESGGRDCNIDCLCQPFRFREALDLFKRMNVEFDKIKSMYYMK